MKNQKRLLSLFVLLALATFISPALAAPVYQSGDIEILSASSFVVAPGRSFRPKVTVRVNQGQLLGSRGDMLRNTDGKLYGAWPHVAVIGTVNAGGTYTFEFYADHLMIAPDAEGNYESKWRVWRDGNWAGPEATIRFQVHNGGGDGDPAMPDIKPRSVWHAVDPIASEGQTPNHIVIHHTVADLSKLEGRELRIAFLIDPLRARNVRFAIRDILTQRGDGQYQSIAGTWAGLIWLIQAQHMLQGPNGKPLDDIGYHYLIAPDGTIYQGRKGGPETKGESVANANTGVIAIAYLGNYQNNMPTQASLQSGKELVDWLVNKYGPNGLTYTGDYKIDYSVGGEQSCFPTNTEAECTVRDIAGHRDFLNKTFTGKEDCPGDNLQNNLDFFRGLVPPRSAPTYPLASKQRGLLFGLFSPAVIGIVDPLGRRLGVNPMDGQYVNEIPGGNFGYQVLFNDEYGEDETPFWINVPDPIDGMYHIDVLGTGSGAFTLGVEELQTSNAMFDGGTITTGVLDRFQLIYSTQNPGQFTLMHDVTPPQSTLSIGLPQYANGPPTVIPNVTPLTLTATDTESGVQSVSYRFFLQGTPAPEYTTQPGDTVQFMLNGPDGVYEVHTFATDLAGNVETAHVQFIRLSNTRVLNGLQALYTFEEGNGTIVHDGSGVGAPLDLSIAEITATHWISGGLVITAPTQLASNAPATKITDAISTSGELTIEAWVIPADVRQRTLARIVTLSNDRIRRNVELLQERDEGRRTAGYSVRVRTSQTGRDGKPELQTAKGIAIPTLQHVVYTRDALGVARIYVDGVELVRATRRGDFTTWDTDYQLVLANALTGDRPWLGTYNLVAFYNRALSPAEVKQNFRAGSDGAISVPIHAELQAHYTFEENGGTVVHDVASSDTPIDLQIGDPRAVRWAPGGLIISSTTILTSKDPAPRLSDAARATNEVTIEAWVRPTSNALEDPGSIVSIATNPRRRFASLVQDTSDQRHFNRYIGQIRTTATSANGTSLKTPRHMTTNLTHIVYTRDASGITRIYLNGVRQADRTIRGDFSRWEVSARLVLANELRGDRGWLGEYQEVAVYNRSLSPWEISNHFRVGPNASPN